LQPFLLLLIGYEVGTDDQPVARKSRGTIKEALDASNAAFKKIDRTTVSNWLTATLRRLFFRFPRRSFPRRNNHGYLCGVSDQTAAPAC
jgi:hypothetical protein